MQRRWSSDAVTSRSHICETMGCEDVQHKRFASLEILARRRILANDRPLVATILLLQPNLRRDGPGPAESWGGHGRPVCCASCWPPVGHLARASGLHRQHRLGDHRAVVVADVDRILRTRFVARFGVGISTPIAGSSRRGLSWSLAADEFHPASSSTGGQGRPINS
jgi:hypothetical protein